MPGSGNRPEVYVQEIPAGLPSVVSVPTGIAAFIGTTALVEETGEGGEAVSLVDRPVPVRSLAEYEARFGRGDAGLGQAVRLFYANGGGTCYVVSVGATADAPSAERLRAGLAALEGEGEATIVVVPESVDLAEDEHYALARETIAHCAATRSRMAIVDLHRQSAMDGAAAAEARIVAFRAAMASVPQAERRFGAAYFPSLRVGSTLVAPSAAMAGIWNQVDAARGVWKAPANVQVAGIDGLGFAVGETFQEGMNVSVSDGLSINAIRAFPGRGTLVWGARTLDGNSFDYRYIPVVRTLTMIEGSIGAALAAFVFSPNDAATWVSVRAMAENYLLGLWQQGALAGTKPEDSYAVRCGLGSTMTAQDILDGRLLVTAMVALLRPGEFQSIAFELAMQTA